MTYRAVATTRFAEFFTSSSTLTWGAAGSTVVLDTGDPALGVVPGSVRLTSTAGDGTRRTPTEGRQFSVDAASGTIRFSRGSGGDFPAVGAEVTAVYLVPPISRETDDPSAGPPDLGPVLLEVPSAARPHAPKVRYVLPTYGWEDEDVTSGGEVVGHTSTRRGNGLRIYLERPWWSSGDGELLGVVLWPLAETTNPPDPEDTDDPSVDSDRRRPYLTMWGQDPLYGSRLLPSRFPKLAHFPDAEAQATDLTLGELGSSEARPVNVAGHPVAFDASRDLWYCDLTVGPTTAYSPFVRLALARWQPHSIPDAELSPVVLADVTQLAPDRIATVVFDDVDPSTVDLTLSGPTHTATEASHGTDPGLAHVLVERQRDGVEGPLGWEPVGPPQPLAATLFNGVGTWTGQVQLPAPRGSEPFRLVVEQFEKLGREPMKKPIVGPITPLLTPRLVHTDIVTL